MSKMDVIQVMESLTLAELVQGNFHLPQRALYFVVENPSMTLRELLCEEEASHLSLKEQVELFQMKRVRQALLVAGNNRGQAANILKICRVSLWKRMKKWGWA